MFCFISNFQRCKTSAYIFDQCYTGSFKLVCFTRKRLCRIYFFRNFKGPSVLTGWLYKYQFWHAFRYLCPFYKKFEFDDLVKIQQSKIERSLKIIWGILSAFFFLNLVARYNWLLKWSRLTSQHLQFRKYCTISFSCQRFRSLSLLFWSYGIFCLQGIGP